MAIGMYVASIPVYQRQLGAISKILEKGSAWAAARKVDEAVLGATRLIPDMLPLTRQVQIACRFAEESAARLAGVEVPKAPENGEKTLGELRARIAAVLAYLKGMKPEQIDGSEGREVVLTIAGNHLRHRIHRLPEPVAATRLRLLVKAAHGVPAARVFSIRAH